MALKPKSVLIIVAIVAAIGFVLLTSQSGVFKHPISSPTLFGGIRVVSAKLVQPYHPGGPTVEITLQNQRECCVTNLSAILDLSRPTILELNDNSSDYNLSRPRLNRTAILELNRNYTFTFSDVSASSPLDKGQSASATETLIGGGFDTSASYPLIIKGTTQDTAFTDIVQVQISQS